MSTVSDVFFCPCHSSSRQHTEQARASADLQKTVKPYQDIYTRDVAPYLSQAYAYSLTASHASYTFYVGRVHPLVVSSLRQLHAFYVNHADPAMRRAYSLYVRPQIDRLLAKIFERKAHATGSEAIRQTKQDVREVRAEGDAKTKAAVDEAEASARKSQEDPSVVDRIKQAATAAVGRGDEDEDPIEVAKLDAELDAELEKINEQLDAWLVGLKKLESQEYVLVTQRIAELRNRKLADLPDHFATLSETHVEEEVASILVKLEKVFNKLSIDASKPSSTLDERLEKARKTIEEQLAKLDASEAELQSMVQGYASDLTKDEAQAVKASSNEIKRFIKEAAKSFDRIMGEAKFERSVEEYEGWDDGLAKRASFFREELQALVAGKAPYRSSGIENTTDLRKEPKLDKHIDELQKQVTKLYKAARSQVDSYASTGILQLQGQGSLGAIADVRDNIVEQARSISEGAAASMYAAAVAARRRLGIGGDEEPAQGILARVGEQARTASRSLASAAGASPTPEGVQEHVESAYDAATSQLGEAAIAAGLAKKPKGPLDNVRDAYEGAAKQAGQTYNSAASQAGDAYASAADAGHSASSYVASAVGGQPSPLSAGEYVEQYADAVQDGLKSASSMAASAVGATPSPESAGEYVEHYAGVVGDAAGSVFESAADLGSRGVEQGAEGLQGVYDGVKEAVGLGESEEDKLVGKNAETKDYNTVGKAAKEAKDRVAEKMHQEL